MMSITDTVKQLLIVNILLFFGSIFVPAVEQLLPLYYIESGKFHFWQFLTSMFMHGSLTHLFFNMFALYSFGSALEHFWGAKKFLFFYISCGLGAGFIYTAVNYYEVQLGISALVDAGYSKATITELFKQGKYDLSWESAIPSSVYSNMMDSYKSVAVGASGAIYGLLVAFAFMFPMAELSLLFIPVPIRAKYFVPGILAIDLYLGLQGRSIFGSGGTGIAHFAHLGGALFGFIMMWYWKKNQFNKNRWD